jgi:hypothetical protein
LRGNRNDRFNGGDCVAVILGSYLSRSPLSDRATIGAIDVKALVERIIKVDRAGFRMRRTNFPAPQGLVNFQRFREKRPPLLRIRQHDGGCGAPGRQRFLPGCRLNHYFRSACSLRTRLPPRRRASFLSFRLERNAGTFSSAWPLRRSAAQSLAAPARPQSTASDGDRGFPAPLLGRRLKGFICFWRPIPDLLTGGLRSERTAFSPFGSLTLVGHSTGADISMYFAKLYPARTTRPVTASAASRGRRRCRLRFSWN